MTMVRRVPTRWRDVVPWSVAEHPTDPTSLWTILPSWPRGVFYLCHRITGQGITVTPQPDDIVILLVPDEKDAARLLHVELGAVEVLPLSGDPVELHRHLLTRHAVPAVNAYSPRSDNERVRFHEGLHAALESPMPLISVPHAHE